MFNRNPFPLLPLALAAVAALPATAAETAQTTVQQITPAVVEVRSDGNNYVGTVVPQIQIRGKVRVQLDAGVSGRVKTWSIWPKLVPVNAGVGYEAQFQQNKTTKSYDAGQRPKSVDEEAWMAMSHDATRNYAVSACQTRATQLRTAGKTDQEIFSTDRAIPLQLQAALSYEFSGVSVGQPLAEVVGNAPTFNIICKASAQGMQGTAVGGGIPTNSPALLQQVSMSASAPIGPTRCPAEVTTFMTFKTDASQAPGYVRYRVKSLSGKVSPLMTVQFSASDRNGSQYVKTVPQSFMVGVPPAPPAPATGTPLVGSQASGDYASPTRPDPNSIVRGQGRPTGPTGEGAAGAPTPANVHKDSLWVDVETAQQGSAAKSNYAAYTVTCDVIQTGVGGGAAGGVRTPVNQPSPRAPRGEAQPTAAPQPPERPPVPLGLAGTQPPTPTAPTRGSAGEAQPTAAPQPPARPAAPLGVTTGAQPLPPAAASRLAAPAASQPRR
jgi:hypothetical protein